MSEVNDEVNNDEVDNENSQVLEIMPPRNNDKVEGEEEEEPGEKDLTLSESVEKMSESGALNEITADEVTGGKVSPVYSIHGNYANNSPKQHVEGLEDKEEDKFKNNSKVGDPNCSKSKSRHKLFKCCPEGFCELVARRKHRTDKLMERQAEISTRLATLEAWLPTVTLNKIIQSDCDPRNVIKCIEEQAAIMSSVTKQSMLKHETHEIGGLGAERKEAFRRHEEARRVLHEKQLQLKKLNEQIEDASRKQAELQRKIYEAERSTGESEDLVDESESEYSFGPGDLENLARIEELIVAEKKVKKDLKELERREAAYLEILRSTDFSRARRDPGGNADGEVDKLRGQLAAKSSANQQLADRICQLEDQIENLESKLRNCNHKIIEFSEKQRRMKVEEDNTPKLKEKMKTTNGTSGDSEISVRDKATLAKVITTDKSSGIRTRRKGRSSFDGKITEEKSVNAVVGTSSKTTHTTIEVTDRAVQDPILESIAGEKSVGSKKISIQGTDSYSSNTSSKSFEESKAEDSELHGILEGETGEETVERFTTFDEAQTSETTLLSRADNESSRVGVDSSWNNDKTLGDNSPSLDDNRIGEMDTGSGKRPSSHSFKNKKLEAEGVSRNPESLLDDSTANKSAHLDLSTIPELEDHKTSSINDQSTQYELELPFGGPKNAEVKNTDRKKPDVSRDHDSINDEARDQSSQYRFGADRSDRRSGSGDKSFVSMKSRLSKEETNYDVSGVPDDIYQSRDQSKHSSMRFQDEENKSPTKNYERSFADDRSFVSLKSQLSKDQTNFDISGVPDDERNRNQSKHSSVRFEDTQKNDERSSSAKSFRSMKSQLSKELTNYEFSDVENDSPEPAASNGRSHGKSFVSLKSQLSKEETDYGLEHAASGQEFSAIVVQRNELKSWLKNLDGTHSVISKCKECHIKKPEVIEIIEAIRRHLGIGSVSGVTKTTDQPNQVQIRRANYDQNQDLMTDGKRSLIKKRDTKPRGLELRQQQSIGEEEEMIMIKEHIGLPSGTSTPIDKESKQTTELVKDNDGIDLPRSIQYSVPREASLDVRRADIDAIRSESINARSIGTEANTLDGNNVSSRVQIQVAALDYQDNKPSDKHFKTTTDTITSSTMDKVDGERRDVGTLATPSLLDESQSHEPDAPLLLNENTRWQKHQNRDETNNSGAASIVLPSVVDIKPDPQGITTTATAATTTSMVTATSSGGGGGAAANTATASTSTSNLSRRGEGKPRSKGHEVLTEYSVPQGEIFQDIRQPGGRNTGWYETKMNSSESIRALSMRMEDVNRKIDESRAWRNRDKVRRDDRKKEDLREIRDKDGGDPEEPERLLRKRMKIYENKETAMKEFDGLSDTEEDRKKLMKNLSDNRPITAGQTIALDKKSSLDCPDTCCICHRKQQGKKLTKSQYEELVAGAGPTRVCLIESTSEFSDQQTHPSHKTKPSKSSPRKPEAAVQTVRLRHRKPKGYPDFSCEVCDCDPCGSNKSNPGSSSPRSEETTRTRSRSTARFGR